MARSGVPRADKETLFLARMSEASTYHPRLKPVERQGALWGSDGRAFVWHPLETGGRGPGYTYAFQGTVPRDGRFWRFSAKRMDELLAEGRIERSVSGTWRMKRYVDEVPPVEESLDWEDIPSILPHTERVAGGDPQAMGYQLPLAAFERIIQIASDERDPVLILAPDEYGTGAVACHRAGRRWVSKCADVQKLGIVDHRLAAERAAYVRCGAIDLRDLPVAAVSGPALLLTADQMRETSVREKALRGVVGRTFHSDVERQLAESLLDAGVIAIHGFKVPGTNLEVDFFLPGPPFGVVEIKHFKGTEAVSAVAASVEKAVDHLKRCRAALSPEAMLYLVLFGLRRHETPAARTLPRFIKVIIVPDGQVKEAAARIVSDYASSAPPTALAMQLAADEDELTKSLSALSIKLDAHFLADGQQVLEHEIKHLREEIGHGHFTAAALRVGRSLEFIVYAACKSWNVKVREPILVGLTTIEAANDRLTKSLIAYADLDREHSNRPRMRTDALRAAKTLLSVVMDVVADVDGSTLAGSPTAQPARAVQALLKDIGKSHGKYPPARNLAKKLDIPVDALLKLRNAAAHASTEGVAREVTKEDLRIMVEHLSTVLLELSRCGEAIMAPERGGGS